MSADETRQVIEGFLGSLAGHWLAEDVDFLDSARSRHYRGRADVAAWFARCRPPAARPLVIVDDGYAVVELKFRDKVAGRVVPTATIYEVRAGEIAVARLYCAE